MERIDDRTPYQKVSHAWLIIGTDSCMSGWGRAGGKASYAAWACEPKDRHRVLDWVENRSDMKRVRETCDPYTPGSNCGHLHIYVVEDDHPALNRGV